MKSIFAAVAATAISFGLTAPSASAESSALNECWATSDNRIMLGECLRSLKNRVDQTLQGTYDKALDAEAELDEIVGQRQASRALERAQKAFELYRDLDCHLQELQAGAGTGSGDFFLGCWIDMTRARVARLQALLPETDDAMGPFGNWSVETLDGGKILSGTRLTLTIESEDTLGGDGGCNRFFGPLKLDPINGPEGEIEIGPLGATRKACGDMIDDQEARFLRALAAAEVFRVTGGDLSLLDSDGAVLLRFSRTQ